MNEINYTENGVVIKKKLERIAFAVFKFVYIITAIAVAITYISELLSPTATYCSITSNDWFTLAFMSVVFCIVTEREKKYKAQIAETTES